MTFWPDTIGNEADFASNVQHFHSWHHLTSATFARSRFITVNLFRQRHKSSLMGSKCPYGKLGWAQMASLKCVGPYCTVIADCLTTVPGVSQLLSQIISCLLTVRHVPIQHSNMKQSHAHPYRHDTTCSNEYSKIHSLRGVPPVFAVFSMLWTFWRKNWLGLKRCALMRGFRKYPMLGVCESSVRRYTQKCIYKKNTFLTVSRDRSLKSAYKTDQKMRLDETNLKMSTFVGLGCSETELLSKTWQNVHKVHVHIPETYIFAVLFVRKQRRQFLTSLYMFSLMRRIEQGAMLVPSLVLKNSQSITVYGLRKIVKENFEN